MGGLLGKGIQQNIDEATGEQASDILRVAESSLRKAMQDRGMSVVDSSAIQNADADLSAKEDGMTKASGLIVPAGYRFVPSRRSIGKPGRTAALSVSRGTNPREGARVRERRRAPSGSAALPWGGVGRSRLCRRR